MIKWFAYIVLLLILIPCLSSANIDAGRYFQYISKNNLYLGALNVAHADTTVKTPKQLKQQEADNKNRVKELTNAKHLPKPEKVDQSGGTPATPQPKPKPKRQRRPAGLERPPELPRRYGN